MGTDTMAYAASALSFMLNDLAKPVVMTGSMVPFAEAYSDARRNLVMSMIFAAYTPRRLSRIKLQNNDERAVCERDAHTHTHTHTRKETRRDSER